MSKPQTGNCAAFSRLESVVGIHLSVWGSQVQQCASCNTVCFDPFQEKGHHHLISVQAPQRGWTLSSWKSCEKSGVVVKQPGPLREGQEETPTPSSCVQKPSQMESLPKMLKSDSAHGWPSVLGKHWMSKVEQGGRASVVNTRPASLITFPTSPTVLSSCDLGLFWWDQHNKAYWVANCFKGGQQGLL